MELDYEYLLSQQLDGTLSPDDEAVLLEAISRNPKLQAVQAQYQAIDRGFDLLAVDKHIDFSRIRSHVTREIRATIVQPDAIHPHAIHPHAIHSTAIHTHSDRLKTDVGRLRIFGIPKIALKIAAAIAIVSGTGILAVQNMPGRNGVGPSREVAISQKLPMKSSAALVRIELADLPEMNSAVARVELAIPDDLAAVDAAMLFAADPDASSFRVMIAPNSRSLNRAGSATQSPGISDWLR